MAYRPADSLDREQERGNKELRQWRAVGIEVSVPPNLWILSSFSGIDRAGARGVLHSRHLSEVWLTVRKNEFGRDGGARLTRVIDDQDVRSSLKELGFVIVSAKKSTHQ